MSLSRWVVELGVLLGGVGISRNGINPRNFVDLLVETKSDLKG